MRPKSYIININTPYIHTIPPSYPNIKSHHPIQPFTPKSHQINPYTYPPTHLSTYLTSPPLLKKNKTKSSTTHNACVHANPVHICIQPPSNPSICSPNATFPTSASASLDTWHPWISITSLCHAYFMRHVILLFLDEYKNT